MESFFNAINSLASLTSLGKQALADRLQYFQFAKGHVLVKQESPTDHPLVSFTHELSIGNIALLPTDSRR